MRYRTAMSVVITVGALLGTPGLSAQPQPAPASPSRSDMGSVSKNLGDEALRLKEETARGLKKLDDLERQLTVGRENTENAGRTVDELLSLLREGAARLSPDAAYVRILNAQEATVRDFANRAASHADGEIRKLASWYKDKAEEIATIRQEAEQLRTRLLTQIDRLEQQKGRLEFAVAAVQIDQFIKNARAYLDTLNDIATGAKSLADNLGNAFGTTQPTQ
jgi:DNA repair exonuclease SbcCD ATPase subunit